MVWHSFIDSKNSIDGSNVKIMNYITVHGKVTNPAEMKLITINGEPVPVAVFTVVDIGLPYQQIEPTFFLINYPKEAASMISNYLVKDKEVIIHGTLRQKNYKNSNGERIQRYFVRADMVELLPVFNSAKTKVTMEDISHG